MLEEEAEALWLATLSGARTRRPGDPLLRARDAVVEGTEGATLLLDDDWDLELDKSAYRAARELTEGFAARDEFALRADSHELLLETLRLVGRNLLLQEPPLDLTSLVGSLKRSFAKSVVVLPLGGIYSSARDPIQIGTKVVVGHLSTETETALGDLARHHSTDLSGFAFTREAWWTEYFLAAEEDGGLAAELEKEEQETGSWQPLVFGAAIDYVGDTAEVVARAAAESLLGAAFLLNPTRQGWITAPPWILGTPSWAENPRAPYYLEADPLPTDALHVDTRADRGISGRTLYSGSRQGNDIDLAPLFEGSGGRFLQATVDGATRWKDKTGTQFRLAMMCRLVLAAANAPIDLGSLLLTRAQEVAPENWAQAARAGEGPHLELPEELHSELLAYPNRQTGMDEVLSAAWAFHTQLNVVRQQALRFAAELSGPEA